jgi:hypothetical protein
MIPGRNLVVVLGAALAAAALASSAASSTTATATPTRASWAAAANRVCTASYAQIRALPKPRTHALYVSDVRKDLQIAQQVDARLAAIPRPAAERPKIAKLLTLSHQQEAVIEHAFLPALLQGDFLALERASARLKPLGNLSNKLARALGARVCAQDPSPQG